MLSFPLHPIVASIGDPEGTRTITAIIALLLAIGLALVLLAVWIFKSTRPDRELLAPLEVMGDRSWRRKDPVWQRRRLDEVRPPGAHPLVPSAAPPELDASFDAGPSGSGFDDLREGEPPRPAADRPAAVEHDGTDFDANDLDAADRDAADEPAAPTRLDPTPPGVPGPELGDLPDDEFDPDALAAAREQLERELSEASRRSANEQLGLFDGDHRM